MEIQLTVTQQVFLDRAKSDKQTTIRKPPRCCKTYRLRIGRLADGREAFAKAGYCISALGDYRYVEVWVRNHKSYGGAKLYSERNYASPGSSAYREMFALVQGVDKYVPGTLPIRICEQLDWTP